MENIFCKDIGWPKVYFSTNLMKRTSQIVTFFIAKGSRKKSSYLNGRAIKALPPPPLGLNSHWNLKKKFSRKIAGNGF